jgi:hypothetical protein
MSQLPPILNYQPTYAVTGREDGAKLVEATLNDFMIPEEFINAACGVLQRRGHPIKTVGDLVERLQHLDSGDHDALKQAGILQVYIVGDGQPMPSEGKPYARVWSWREPVDGLMRIAVNVAKMYQTTPSAAVPITAPILSRQIAEDP